MHQTYYNKHLHDWYYDTCDLNGSDGWYLHGFDFCVSHCETDCERQKQINTLDGSNEWHISTWWFTIWLTLRVKMSNWADSLI